MTLPAEVYLWSIALDARVLEAPPEVGALPDVREVYSGEVRAGAVRMFRDGSRGLLVEIAGAGPLDGLRVELRGFAEQAPVSIVGLGARAGAAGYAELLDPLWLGLSPPFDGNARGALRASWGVGPEGVEPVTWRWAAGCEALEESRGVRHRACAGPLSLGPERLWAEGDRAVWIGEALGALQAEAVFERARLTRWAALATREIVTRWPGGAVVRQEVRVQAALQRIGAGELPEPAPNPDVEAARADLAPLIFGDGAVPAPARPPAENLPFLVLSRDLSEERRLEVRNVLLGRGRMGPEAAPP